VRGSLKHFRHQYVELVEQGRAIQRTAPRWR
jgi:NADH-quinone oxidoreductase subunit F